MHVHLEHLLSESKATVRRQFGIAFHELNKMSFYLLFLFRIYKLQRQHARRADHMFNIRVFLTLNWMSDVFGCVGAVLAQQLTTQVRFVQQNRYLLYINYITRLCLIH